MKTSYSLINSFPVINGVMMRSRGFVAIAVRKSNQKIWVRSYPYQSWEKKGWLLGLPFVRGVSRLLEGTYQAVHALSYSISAHSQKDVAERAQGPSLAAFFGVLSALFAGIFFFTLLPEMVLKHLAISRDAFAYSLVVAGIKLTIVIIYLIFLTWLSPLREVLSHKGAAHATLKTFNQNADLTLENIRSQSPYYLRGMETQILAALLISILLINVGFPMLGLNENFLNPVINQSVLLLIKVAVFLPVLAVIYEVQRWLSFYIHQPMMTVIAGPYFLLQRMLVRHPNDAQMELALIALRQVLRLEKGIPSPVSQTGLDVTETGDEEFEISGMNELGRVRIDVSDFLEN